jgi:hypothetical protein
MRKHGWQLPYHPLQVVAIAVFAALGFAFYVFFLPFVGGNTAQYVALGLYTPLVSFPSCPPRPLKSPARTDPVTKLSEQFLPSNN